MELSRPEPTSREEESLPAEPTGACLQWLGGSQPRTGASPARGGLSRETRFTLSHRVSELEDLWSHLEAPAWCRRPLASPRNAPGDGRTVHLGQEPHPAAAGSRESGPGAPDAAPSPLSSCRGGAPSSWPRHSASPTSASGHNRWELSRNPFSQGFPPTSQLFLSISSLLPPVTGNKARSLQSPVSIVSL